MPQPVLPLFPLPNVVLFPGMLLPLHIFEERYKTMMRDILGGQARFGILLCKEYNPETLQGKPFDIGTVAEVVEYELLADGRMNVLAMGTQRFKVSQYDEDSKPYLQGQVSWLQDSPVGKLPKGLVSETAALFEEAMRLTYKILEKPPCTEALPDTPEAMAFAIAHHLRGSLVLKQDILEMSSTQDRLTFERDVLDKIVRSLAVRSQIEDAFRDCP